jgi:acetylornithine deacetylase/succinyl-diaminopimelate desuccinylase-like protein
MINRDRIVEAFLKYVQIDSPTKREGNFARFIAKELEDLGLEVYIDGAGKKVGSDTGNVIAKLKGTKNVQPILFSCHMDTVSPGEGIKPFIKDDVIYSDGTTVLGGDDKAGIAAVVEALRVIKENYSDIYTRNKLLVTTEKDAMRMLDPEVKEQASQLPFYYIPMEIDFHEKDKQIFDETIIKYVKENKRER